MVGPHVGERLFDMFEVEKETEDELVAQNRLARDYERQRELDMVIKSQGVDSCINPSENGSQGFG